MRNLKKVLSLALALVMLVGMMVVGAGAAATDFGDDSSIEYKEAAAVLNAVNVLKGKDTGNFDPKGDLTRAQAATIIYRMIMGGMEKEPEPATTGFTDVDGIARLSWATGYIAACVERGIIVGVSETRFNPDGQVKGTDFAKMLLVALGYDADSQGYGAGSAAYASSVARDARTNGISITGVALDGYLNREQAAQMAMNTMVAVVKEQQPGISVNGVVIPGGKAEDVDNDTSDYNGSSDGKMQFCELYFPQLKQKPGETTDLGQPASVWTVADEEVASVTEEPVVTYTADTTADNIIRDLKNYKVDDGTSTTAIGANAASTMTVVDIVKTNGTESDLTVSSGTTPAAAIAALANKNGKIVEIYANGTTITNIVVIEKTVGKVSSDPTTRTSNDEEQVRVPGVFSTWKNVDKVHGWEDLAKGDVVLYVNGTDGNVHIEKAEAIEGVVTGTRGTELRIDGAYYDVSELANAATGWATNDFKNTYTFYLDNGGFIVAGTTEAQTTAATQYAVVLDSGWYTGANLTEGAHAEAKLLFTDGSVEIVTVSKVDGDDADDNGTKIRGVTDGTIVTYVESDGKYELTNTGATTVSRDDTNGLMVTKGSAQMTDSAGANKHTVNNATIFLVKNGDNAYSVYTGKDEVPTISGAGAQILKVNSIARVVYITDGTASDVEASDYVYIPTRVAYTAVPNEAGNGVAYYEIENAIVNGAEETLRVKSNGQNVENGDNGGVANATLAANTLYKVARKEADTEAVTLFKTVTPDGTGIALGDGVVVVANDPTKTYTVNEDTVIYRITADHTSSSMAWDASFTDATDDVYVEASNGTAKTVVIVEQTGSDATATITYSVDGGAAVTPVFDGSNNATVSPDASDASKPVEFTVAPTDAGATYTISPETVTIPANGGTAVDVTIVVTSEDSTASTTYKITFNPAAAPAPESAAITGIGTPTVTIASASAISSPTNGKDVPKATATHEESNADKANGTGTITVTLKSGGNTVADNDTIEIPLTLPSGATISEVSSVSGAAVTTTAGSEKITLTRTSSAWPASYKVKVVKDSADVTYTVSVEAAASDSSASGATVTIPDGQTGATAGTASVGNSGSNGAEDITISVTGQADSGDKLSVKVVANSEKATIDGVSEAGDSGRYEKSVELSYNGTTWTTGTVKIIAEDGSWTEYTVKTQ